MSELNNAHPAWSFTEKLFFRFFFIFFNLYIFHLFGMLIPVLSKFFHWLIPWIGEHILNLSYKITVFTNGSGDTTYDYVNLLFIFAVAVTGCAVWSVADRKRKQYITLLYFLLLVLRCFLAMILISYGMAKLVKTQFPYPGNYRLTEAYGDSSPMGLAWTFLGFSGGYNVLMGIAEVLAIVLLFRKLVTFGALITLFTTANIMAINYFYDVPVKILSTMLFVMCLFLLAVNTRPLFQFFVNGKPAVLRNIPPPYAGKRRLVRGILIAKVLVAGGLLIALTTLSFKYGNHRAKPPLYGIYDVETFVIGKDTIQPLQTSIHRWKQLIIPEWPGAARVKLMNDSVSDYSFKPDTVKKQVPIDFPEMGERILKYQLTPSGKLVFYTFSGDDTIRIHLQKQDPARFKLMKTPFHWIQEYPNNR